MSARTLRASAAAVVLAGAVAVTVAAFALGIVGWERYTGYFAPVWDQGGRRVFWLVRETRGFVWGMGWEHFSPPAYSYVYRDQLSLQELDPATGAIRELDRFEGSPLVGRVRRHYRGRIFNSLRARLHPTDDGLEILVALSIPRVPSSEQWSLAGTWREGSPSGAAWAQKSSGPVTTDDGVLRGGTELITVPGVESFPCAVVSVDARGDARVLASNQRFGDLYPDGVPAALLAERSQRGRIERGREFRRVNEELVAEFRARGMNDGQARLRAYDEMEERGYLPKSPKIVATRVASPPAGVRVFEIPDEYLEVGLFQDIAAAIAAPGREHDTGTGTYLKYYDDDLGPRLAQHRAAGNDRFAVRTGGAVYLLEVRRFER